MKILYIERKQFGKVIKVFERKINLLRFLFKNYDILLNKVLSITIPIGRSFGFIIRFIMSFTKYDFKFNQRKYNIFQ